MWCLLRIIITKQRKRASFKEHPHNIFKKRQKHLKDMIFHSSFTFEQRTQSGQRKIDGMSQIKRIIQQAEHLIRLVYQGSQVRDN